MCAHPLTTPVFLLQNQARCQAPPGWKLIEILVFCESCFRVHILLNEFGFCSLCRNKVNMCSWCFQTHRKSSDPPLGCSRPLRSLHRPRVSMVSFCQVKWVSSVCERRGSVSATDKVALLIGNMNYLHHTPLCAPICDVHELTNLLRQMDFKVVSLLDLNWQEMQNAVAEFLMLLDRGVYGQCCSPHEQRDEWLRRSWREIFSSAGLLYFAGHGYENYGNSFMVPIDAPASYTSDHCLCVQSILSRMQEKQTGLNVFLLDMCRQRNFNDDVIVHPGLLKVTANIVFGYATWVPRRLFLHVFGLPSHSSRMCNGSGVLMLKRMRWRERTRPTASSSASSNNECVKTRRSPSCWTKSLKVGGLGVWNFVFLFTCTDPMRCMARDGAGYQL